MQSTRTRFAAAALIAVVGTVAAALPASASQAHAPQRARIDRVPVLEYHRFESLASLPHAEERYSVPLPLFTAQLRAMRAGGWHSITAAQYEADLAAGRPPAPKTVIITIDDGHADGMTKALPALQAAGMTATYYVIGARIGEHRNGACYLSAAELVTLRHDGMEIGNHTMHHVHLARLSARQQLREITSAQRRLTKVLGVAPVTMAYPFGSFDATTERAAAKAGIRLAFDSVAGAKGSWDRRLHLPRLLVTAADSPARLLARLTAVTRG